MPQGAQNYAVLPLAEQVTLVQRELPVRDALLAKSGMWRQVLTELTESHRSFTEQTDTIAPTWPDSNGRMFVRKNRNAEAIMEEWVQKVGASDLPTTYTTLGNKISETEATVIRNYNAAQAEIRQIIAPTQAAADAAQRAIEERYQRLNAAVLEALDAEYDKATTAVEQATSGRDFARELDAAGPGAGPGATPGGANAAPDGGVQAARSGGAPDGGVTGGENGGEAGAAPAGGVEGGAAGGAPGGGVQAGGAGDPSLSGGLSGGAPVAPPGGGLVPGGNVPPGGGLVPGGGVPGGGVTGNPAPLLPVSPAAGVGSSFRPSGPGVSGGGGGAGGGGYGGGAGGAGAGGVRVPGVSVGGGPTQIPSAAAPVSAASLPTTGTPPAVPASAAPGAVPGGPAGPGGIPPMMPPMGGMGGAAGAGGGPGGPGGAQSRPRNRRREDERTPGVLPVLTGKAGMPLPAGFRSRKRDEESDVPTTVQLIDEDLWQVTDKAPAVVDWQAPERRLRT